MLVSRSPVRPPGSGTRTARRSRLCSRTGVSLSSSVMLVSRFGGSPVIRPYWLRFHLGLPPLVLHLAGLVGFGLSCHHHLTKGRNIRQVWNVSHCFILLAKCHKSIHIIHLDPTRIRFGPGRDSRWTLQNPIQTPLLAICGHNTRPVELGSVRRKLVPLAIGPILARNGPSRASW